MTLLELCYNKPDLILLDSTNSLLRAGLPHYKDIDPDKLKLRFQRLFDSLVNCIESNKFDALHKFMETVSHERYEAGYELNEVQIAINTLEESMWRKTCEFVDSDKQINGMKEVSYLLCKAKQKLLSEYALLSKEYVFA
ncbi:MAG TPA: hypothetical protein VJ455_13015 [Ignavibacteria bacterium]|nr:hypothetical protein [Ignavibacteria bacterium]